MNTLLIVSLVAFLNILVLNWLAPYVTPKSIQFGVRIPREREVAPVIFAARQRYHLLLSIGSICIFVAAFVIPALSGYYFLCLLSVLFIIFYDHLVYFLTFRWLHRFKVKQKWFDGLDEESAVVYDDGPSVWHTIAALYFMIPSLVILIMTWYLGISVYNSLPPTLPEAFNSSGLPSHFVAKGFLSVFGAPAGETALTALILLIGYATQFTRLEIDASRPYTTFEQQTRFKTIYRDVTYVAASMFGITLLLASFRVWYYPALIIPSLLVLLPMFIAFIFWFSSPYYIGQMGSRLVIRGEELEDSGSSEVDDDKEWKGGVFDYNREDPSVFVAKRFGIGWTLNFANRKTWILIGSLSVVAVLLALLLLYR